MPRWGGRLGFKRVPLPHIGAWVLILTVWETVVRWRDIPDFVLASPLSILSAFWANRDWVISNTGITILELLLGFLTAIAIAVPLGVTLVASAPVRRALYPLLVAWHASAKEALAPLLVVWFGFSMFPKILMAVILAFFPIMLGVMIGLERFGREVELLALSMGASRTKTFFSFRVWIAFPSFFSSLRYGIVLATVGVVIGEFLGSDQGIGYVILAVSRRLDGELLYASFFVLVFVVLGLTRLVDLIEHSLLGPSRAKFT